jgi:membrane protease YdiL (CAAX protease family)
LSPKVVRALDGILPRIAVLVLCAGIWFALQWILYPLAPESAVPFLGGGAVSLLSAVPLFLAAFLFPVEECRLTGFANPVLPLSVTVLILVPFTAAALRSGLEWAHPGNVWIATALVLMVMAVSEEMVFRGFLVNVLSFRGSFTAGAVLSSVLFALVHVDNTGATPLGVFNVAVFGFLLVLVRRATNGLAAPAVVHWIWNLATGMVFGWRVSGYDMPSLWTSPGGVRWGTFGPEGSLLLTVVLAAGIVLVLARRGGSSCDARRV